MTAWGFRTSRDGTPDTSNYYRPMQYITYSVLYNVFGLAPGAFHCFKLLLHIANAFLVFWLVNRLVRAPSAALVPALLFSVQPANSEAVLWISAITDVACALFFLLVAALYVKFRETGRWPHAAAIGLLFLIGLFYKETMVAVVPILAAYEILLARPALSWKRRLLYACPVMAALAVYFLLRWHVMGGLYTETQFRFSYLSPLQSTVNQVILFVRYAALFVFPYHLNAFHVFHPAPSPLNAAFAVSVLGLVAALAAAAVAIRRLDRDRRALLILGGIWFAVSIAPVILFFKRIGANVFAERYVYLPSIGLCMIAGVILWGVRDRWRTAFAWIVPLLLLLAAGRTLLRADVWRDEGSFLETTVRQSPDSDLINANLGIWYAQRRNYAEAEKYFRKGIEVSSPVQAPLYVNLGNVLFAQSRYDEAARIYEKVMQARNPRDLDYARLGQTYSALGRFEDAITVLSAGYGINPKQPIICYALGNALLNRQRYAEAVTYLEAAKQAGYPNAQLLARDLDAAQRGQAGK